MTITLAITIGVLYAVGTWLMLQRSLSRIVIGLAVLGHGANLLLLSAGGRAGTWPLAGADPATTADPLPQALALTAIVITFGVSGFLLAMAWRSWRIGEDDAVEDDIEDRRIAEALAARESSRARTDEEVSHSAESDADLAGREDRP